MHSKLIYCLDKAGSEERGKEEKSQKKIKEEKKRAVYSR